MSFQSTGETWSTNTSAQGRAGFWQRFAADCIDWILLGIVGAIIAAILHIAGIVVFFLLSVGYFTALEGGPTGQTIGKGAMRIRVVSLQDHQPIGYQRALIRDLGRILSEIPILLGYFWMLWSPQKQTWHDMFADAVVIPIEQSPRPPKAPW